MKKLSVNDPNVISAVVSALEAGDIVIIPTDTVYGIACDSQNPAGEKKVSQIKGRDESQRVAWLVSDIEMAEQFVEIPPLIHEKLKSVWPGALTAIFKRKDGTRTEGVRAPSYPFVQNLLKDFSRPIAASSANHTGEKPLTKIAEVLERFGTDTRIALIVDGDDLAGTLASTVIDFTVTPPNVIRKGPVDASIFYDEG